MGWRTGRCGASLCRNAGQRSMGQQADLQRQHIHLHGGDEPRDRAPHMVAEAAWNCHPVQVTRKRFMDVSSEIRAVLLHWGLNMWGESLPGGVKAVTGGRRCNDRVRLCDVEKGRSAT